MSKKKMGNKIMSKLLMAMLSVALVFTMMPLSMGFAFADDDPVVAPEPAETVVDEVTAPEEPVEGVTAVENEDINADTLSAKEEAGSSVLIKGNVLKQEKTISLNNLPASIVKTEGTFKGVNRKGSLGTITVGKGVTFVDLINYIGLKDGATIEKFIVTTGDIDSGSTATEETEYSYKWLMEEPDADQFNNGKAMLAFEWQGKDGAETGTQILLGGFSDMDEATQGDYSGYKMNRPKWINRLTSIEVVGTAPEPETEPSTEPTSAPASAPTVKVGQKATVSGSTYTVTSTSKGTVAFTKAKNAKTVTIPATVKVNGKTFKVNKIAAKAFKGKKTKKIIVKTKALTKKSVKGSLKGSKVKTVKVKVGSKKVNKKYVKKYKKIFTKKNVGKKVKVKR